MPRRRHSARSDLFLLRVWSEEDEEGLRLWCGKVQHTVSGTERDFCALNGLTAVLEDMLMSAAGNPRTAPELPEGQPGKLAPP